MANESKNSWVMIESLIKAPAPPVEARGERKFEVNVIFSTARGTQAALKAAQELAQDLNAQVLLLVPQVVPRQFPLSSPPVSIAFTERRTLALAKACQKDADIHVKILLCVDKRECLLNVLQPRSLVLIGGRKRWWPAPEQKLARTLLNHGHRVIFVREID